jgi:metal-responsive CopG/Arc/MetJ family transcriptional regulator
MPRLMGKVQYERASVSLRSEHLDGVKRIAADDGHGNFSRVIQDVLEDELKRRYGRDWQQAINGAENGTGAALAAAV